MNIALIGARGQLGTALQSVLAGRVTPLDRDEIDVGNRDSVQAVLAQTAPDAVVNAAAYNFVDRAEQEPQTAFAVNAFGPRNLAAFCRDRDLPLVHVSTDYVFSGKVEAAGLGTAGAARQMPYRETDAPEPQSAYAVSKLAGELFVRSGCRRHYILRTCGLYGPSSNAGKGNFVTTMLRLGLNRDEVRIVDDQRCTPTAARDLAEWIAALLETEAYGTFHATNAGSATWFEFAVEIFRVAKRDVKTVPITTAEFGAKAARPGYSVLDCGKLQQTLGITVRPWQEALAEYVVGESRK